MAIKRYNAEFLGREEHQNKDKLFQNQISVNWELVRQELEEEKLG